LHAFDTYNLSNFCLFDAGFRVFQQTLLIILIFAFGFVLGIVFKDIPNLKLNTEVKIFEPLTFLLTATIGLLIPFFIKRWIDDSRQIKNN
jgi:TctA family transporter